MKKTILIRNKAVVVLSSLLLLNSCRSTDTDNTLADSGPVAVNFNLAGSEYTDGDISGVASTGNGNILSNQTQSYTEQITPSEFVIAELKPSSDNIKASASVGNNAIAAIPGGNLTGGTMYRVIAYNPDGSYQAYQDYTAGQAPAPMILQAGTAYTMVCYSYGTTTLPAISAGEQTNISSAQVNYDDVNRDFMYQKVTYTPTSTVTTNVIDFTLRHKVAQITTIVNSYGYGTIDQLSGAVLTPHFSNGVFPLSTGVMTGRTTATAGNTLSFTGVGVGANQATAAPVFVNADTGGASTGSFSATTVMLGGVGPKTVNLPNSFKVTPENKSTLTINFTKCGAYVGPNTDPANYKAFMCQNLGATAGIDPLSPLQGNHGAKYQWGATTGETGRYVNQATDQSNSGTISGWLTTVKPDGTWSDTTKTASDPCPAGFRVPTMAQWQGVIANNTFTPIGSWTQSTTNYSSGVKVGNNLFLPAAGIRDQSNGSSTYRGSYGYYNASSVNTPSQNLYLFFASNSRLVNSEQKTYARSVRCIAQ